LLKTSAQIFVILPDTVRFQRRAIVADFLKGFGSEMAARVVTALPKFGHESDENLEFFLVYL